MMKYKIMIVLSALFLMLSACSKESAVNGNEEESRDAVITFVTGTRSGSTNAGSDADRYINSLRVLGYRTSTGELAFNETVYGIPTQVSERFEYEGNISVRTGKFTVVFVANEHSDAAVSAVLNGITTTENSTLAYLRNQVAFAHTAFASDKDIPMVTVKENIVIQDDNKLIDPAIGTDVLNKWPVSMERIGIRVDLKFAFENEDAHTAWATAKTITIERVPDRVYLFAGQDNTDAPTSKVYSYPSAVYTGTTTKTYDLGRIILPENYFTSATTPEDKAMVLKISADRERACKMVSSIAAHGYTLPRNTFLSATVTIPEDPTADILWDSRVADWDDQSIADVGVF